MNSSTLQEFYNNETLNIFSDASMISRNCCQTGCYGVVGVVGDKIIDSIYKLASNSTNNNSEIKGIRAAISMANKWKNNFKYINIFSDSQISIFGLRNYIFNWRYNPNDNLLYSVSTKNPIANQNIFIECHSLLSIINNNSNCIVKFFHQSGHVDNSYNELKKAAEVFKKSNYINNNIDLNLIRYISTYNNYVDQTSRSILHHSNLNNNYIDPLIFKAQGKIKKY